MGDLSATLARHPLWGLDAVHDALQALKGAFIQLDCDNLGG